MPKNMNEALTLLAQLKNVPVLCAGDIMIDRYIYGQATRISPEAPVPVVRVTRETLMPGGLGNVVNNLGSLGARPMAVSVAGEDANSRLLESLFHDCGWLEPVLVRDPKRPTSFKTRIVAGIQQVVRFDEEDDRPINGAIADAFIKAVKDYLPRTKAVALSDYGKGALPPDISKKIIQETISYGRPLVVDPKGSDYSKYNGATLITPNRKELAEAAMRPLNNETELEAAGRELMSAHNIKNILVTLSEDGMLLLPDNEPPVRLSSQAREVFDVSGAGDTVVAVMAASMAVGAPLSLGARLATLAAGVVVSKVGTATASPKEIEAYAELLASSNRQPGKSPNR